MNTKNILSFLGMFALVFLTFSMVSAASLTIAPTSVPANVLQNAGSFSVSFNLTNTGLASPIDFTGSVLTLGTGSISIPATTLAENESKIITANVTFNSGQTGSISGIIMADGNLTSDTPKNFTFSVLINSSFAAVICGSTGNSANLEVDISDINDEGFGEDDSFWYPLDKISIDVDVDNQGSFDVRDIEVKLCLFDKTKNKCILNEDDMDINDNKFDLDEGDDTKTVTVTFTLNPKDLEAGDTDYEFRAWVTGKIDDNDAGTLNNVVVCTSDSFQIEIRTDEKFVIVNNIVASDQTTPNLDGQVSCGSEVLLTADVWNIGDTKLDSDEVFVHIFNKALGINQVVNMNAIGELDSEPLSTTINIPSNVATTFYPITFEVYDDEALDDSDLYQNSEDDEAVYNYALKVVSCGPVASVEPTINAVLVSGAKVGDNLVVDVTITNNGNSTANFVVAPAAFEAWASSVSVEPSILNLAKGASGKVTVTLNAKESGAQTFDLQVLYNSEVVEKTVNVNIAEKTGFLTGAFSGVGNATLYIIAAIVLILIIVIIALIVKLSSAPKASDF